MDSTFKHQTYLRINIFLGVDALSHLRYAVGYQTAKNKRCTSSSSQTSSPFASCRWKPILPKLKVSAQRDSLCTNFPRKHRWDTCMTLGHLHDNFPMAPRLKRSLWLPNWGPRLNFFLPQNPSEEIYPDYMTREVRTEEQPEQRPVCWLSRSRNTQIANNPWQGLLKWPSFMAFSYECGCLYAFGDG